MTTEAALTVLGTHLLAAGTALSRPITDVSRGLPYARGRQVRYYWDAETEPVRMGGQRTLSEEMVSHRINIAALWPVPDGSETANTALDIEVVAFVDDVRGRILGDSTLGGNCTDLELDYADADLVTIAGGLHLAVRWTLTMDYTAATIGP